MKLPKRCLVVFLILLETIQVNLAQTVEGEWAVNANGATGMMTISRTANGFLGKLNLGIDEEFNLAFDAATGVVTFIRPSCNQHYTGVLSNNEIAGTFDGAYKWTATKQGRKSEITPATSIEGVWAVNANGTTGDMTVTRSGNVYTGKLDLGIFEVLTNFTFNPATGLITFTRPSCGQKYTGVLIINNITGTFDGAYKWSALRK